MASKLINPNNSVGRPMQIPGIQITMAPEAVTTIHEFVDATERFVAAVQVLSVSVETLKSLNFLKGGTRCSDEDTRGRNISR